MTISSTARIAGPFIGDGSTATFPFAFKTFAKSDLSVVTLTVATGEIAELTLDADYTVALNADQDSSPGGSITLTAGNLTAGMTLTLTTDMAALQGVDLTNGGGFYPDVINGALDGLTILIQQLQQQLGRAIGIPLSDGGSMQLPPAAQRAGKLLMFDADGNLALMPMAPGASVPGAQRAPETVNGDNRQFTFLAAAASVPVPMVFAGGVYQTPEVDYAIPLEYVGNLRWKITFTVPPVQGPITIAMFG